MTIFLHSPGDRDYLGFYILESSMMDAWNLHRIQEVADVCIANPRMHHPCNV